MDDWGDWSTYEPYPCLATDRFDDNPYPLQTALIIWMDSFGNETKATAALTLSTYAAANAILNTASQDGDYIYSTQGTDIQKPDITIVGIIIVSLLLVIQITGLTLLFLYASRRATWTESLDAWAMLRLGAELGREEMLVVSALESKRARFLDEKKGWVGDLGVEEREGKVGLRALGRLFIYPD